MAVDSPALSLRRFRGYTAAASPSWPGLVPAIHVFIQRRQDVDARHWPGHDDDLGE